MYRNAHIIGPVDYRSNQRVTLDIDRGEVLTALWIRLQFTITNGGSDAVGPLYQTLARIIRRLEIIVAGRDTVMSVNGETLAAMQYYADRVVARGMDASVVLTASAATSYDVTLRVPFVLPLPAIRPEDTALDLRANVPCTLALTWANSNCSDFYTTPNSAALSAVSCTVEGEYLVGTSPADIFMVRSLDLVSQAIASANTQQQIEIDQGSGVAIRRLFIETLIADIGVDTIIASDYQLAANQTTFQKGYAPALKAQNRSYYGVAPVTGVLILDETAFGKNITILPTTGLPSKMNLTVNAAAPGSGTRLINVTREVIRPLKAA